MEHLRPLSYEEMCQMELLQPCGSNTQPATAAAPTMLPIMVIPTALLAPGAGGAGATQPQGGVEHYYQLQPTHIIAAGVEGAPSGGGSAGAGGELALLQGGSEQYPHGIQLQQHPHSHSQPVNILCTGTLSRTPPTSTAASGLAAASAATLPRSFQPAAFVTDVESDFEGSECGAGNGTTTCMPHFRFGGCGLQSAASHQQQQQPHQDAVVGCGSLSYMMGTLAAGGAMHAGRFAGTLGRNRRPEGHTKRVSFKGDNLPPSPPPPPAVELDNNGLPMPLPVPGGVGGGSYMHFDNYMDYQTTGFGGLPDVTEHSNIRRTLSRQNSISNSDSGGEIASIQKSKVYGNAMTGGVVVGSDIAGIALDSKSPTSLAAEAAAAAGSSSKAKAKSARKTRNSSGAAHKSRRGSWMVALTLVSAICLLAIAATLAYQHFFMSPSRNSHAQRLRIVRRILREVPLVDGHNNFAWNVRKYAHSSLELVHLSHDLDHKSMWVRPAWAQTDMERLKQGLVGVQVWSAYVPCEAQGLDAVQLALEQIDIVRRLSDMYARDTVLATSSQDIVATHRRGLLASVIGIEGGHTIGSSLGVLRSFYSLGARYLSLTHRCDVSWAGSSASTLEQGLTPFGKAIVREMNRLGMMIDLSHSSDATARDVLQLTRAPVIFSHSAARQLCNSTRNVPDDILRLVAENGGLIMLSFDPEDVACGRQARLQDVIEHIKYVRAIAGIQHIGLGAGYDGIEMPPLGLEDVSKYPELLAALLEDHNWSEEDVAMLAGRNFLRILETVETVRDYWKRAAIQPIELSEPQPKTQCTYMSS
ncbi:uncharacterized protein LOC6583325 isoform X2 [Drosophila mojavensis]|uniref:Dipeptidase n=1 Tax=Drosophila mojavensis TaxID=7230 RepID=B4KVK0_DROMO|nr:uncharacterized protein LOC6583325 isoform X2 [Drosophila mojavensis]EDW19471.2 uncharacterized protein Dmoj_GI13799, isoform B [Drosophila mojavensis]